MRVPDHTMLRHTRACQSPLCTTTPITSAPSVWVSSSPSSTASSSAPDTTTTAYECRARPYRRTTKLKRFPSPTSHPKCVKLATSPTRSRRCESGSRRGRSKTIRCETIARTSSRSCATWKARGPSRISWRRHSSATVISSTPVPGSTFRRRFGIRRTQAARAPWRTSATYRRPS